MSPKRTQRTPALPGGVWFREPSPSRELPALSEGKIVAAAIELLDRQGAAKLTMRKLANALTVHPTSLYWYVSNRDDLLDLALDVVLGEWPLPRPHDDWRADLAAFMLGLREVLLRHPWSASVTTGRLLLGPNALARTEFVYAALRRGGFSGLALSAAGAATSNFVIGSVAAQSAWQHEQESAARAAMHEHLRQRAESCPTLAAHHPGVEVDWTAHFTAGMDFLLDGIQARAR